MTFSAVTEQGAVFAFLADPATHGAVTPVNRIDTHGAAVFLADGDAYKVKRSIRYPYMDFSSLEKRKAACEAEITINRDNAPGIYLGAVPITRDGNGLHIAGKGEIIEWAVHMRRFDEERTLDRLADKGVIDAKTIDQLAQAVSDAHQTAPLRSGAPAAIALHNVMNETLGELKERGDIFPTTTIAALSASLIKTYQNNELLLFRRAMRGKVRRCHGDLHLRNIVFQENGPVLFDAIEFNESIATIDILYDLAFLIMDLCERGLSSHACRLLNRYLWLSHDEAGEIEGLSLLPLFLALRAAIRAKVLATQAGLSADAQPLHAEACGYAEAALRFLAPSSCRLVAVGGLSGTGKSVLAGALAPHFGAAPGALHLRSDIERKKAYGVPELARLAQGAYSVNTSANVYKHLGDLARAGVRAGRSVIVDATFQGEAERQKIGRAVHTAIPFQGLWLEAPIETRKARVRGRKDDASDATAEVAVTQAVQGIGIITWPRLDASQAADKVSAAALALLAEQS